jgi:membrane associated rhomboid family serine protease
MQLSITVILIIITALVSFGAFSNHKMTDDLVFYPPAVSERNQWYRFISSGFIHADFGHLAFNMLALYLFGGSVETFFREQLFGRAGGVVYLLLYFSALVVAHLPTYFRHRGNYGYRSLGASGAVSAIVFAGLVLAPSIEVFIFFIPIPIPGFIFAPLYLFLSYLLQKRAKDNINHSAHIWGSIYGAVFVIVGCMLVGFPIIEHFIGGVSAYMQAKGWTH